jgi:aryl-alcohol dehydrogenase-like predicted oxidoreductase
MNYRNLGRSGVKVSSLCLGIMNFGGPTPEDEAIEMIHTALDAGINFIDTADVYNAGESERVLAKALQGKNRENVIIATKFFNAMSEDNNDRGGSRNHILKACEASLKRMQLDYIDLYQMHRPDWNVPIDETLSALTDLVKQGKVRYVGCSTYPAWKVMEALSTSEQKGFVRFITEQPPYNLLDRRIENELVPLAQAYQLGILPWSPLAAGILAGRYPQDGSMPSDSRGARWDLMGKRVSTRSLQVTAKFIAYAQLRGIDPAQLAILWVKDQPAITAPIIGPRTMDQLKTFLPVLDMELTPEDRQFCDELVPPGSVVSDFHNSSGWMKMSLPD